MGYPRVESTVTVVMVDGEVSDFQISASVHIGQYLADSASKTGVLVLFNDHESNSIPLSQIRMWRVHSQKVTE